MKIKLTEEEKETMSYTDVAYLILKVANKKCKIQDLFKKVIILLDKDDSEFEDNIGTFFELIITDKRFIMLDDGYCDLKVNHSSKVIIEDDEEDYEALADDSTFEEIEEDNYDDDASADDDSENELQDLVIVDDEEDLGDSEI